MCTAVALAAGGCSWMFVDAPPRPATAADAPRCTRDDGTAMIDMVLFSAILLGGMLIGAAAAAGDDLDGEEAAWLSGSMLAGGGAFGLSGAYGMHHVKRCKRLNGDL